MSEMNSNERSGWQTYEVIAMALCVGLAMWGLMSGVSASRNRALNVERSSQRQKTGEDAEAKAEKALTTFAALNDDKTRFRVPLDLALKQSAINMADNPDAFREKAISSLPKPVEVLQAQGKALFQTKICFTCHQVDPKFPSPAGVALKAPVFMGKFWGTEREVELSADPASAVFMPSGKFKKVLMDEEYFLESVEKPMAKVVKDTVPGMAPLPTTPEERKALMEYVKSLSEE